MFQVEFYKLENGRKPVGEFIRSIKDEKLRAKVIRGVKLLETFGNKLGMPDSRPLEDGIYELRVIQSSNIARCLYFFMSGEKIILTNGFIKKSRKTPPDEIAIAKERKWDYEQRVKKNQ